MKRKGIYRISLIIIISIFMITCTTNSFAQPKGKGGKKGPPGGVQAGDVRAEGFRKTPYLQNVKLDAITICWELEKQDDTTNLEHYRVEYGIGTYSEVVSYPEAYPTDPRVFQLTLTGLQPGTRYQYRVKSGPVWWSEEATFLTAIGHSQPFTFAVYGDTRTHYRKHKEVVELINSWSPHILLHTGDLWANNDNWAVEQFFTATQDLLNHVPLFPALGNHEYWIYPGPGANTDPDLYRKYFVLPTNLTSTEDYYSFDYGNAHFLVVDTNREESLAVRGSDYRAGSPQYAAIKRDLIQTSQNPDIVHIFVTMHVPVHSNGLKHGYGRNNVMKDPVISRDLGELFQAYDVDIVFSAHEHVYERFQPVNSKHQPVGICDSPSDPTNPDHPCNRIHEGMTYVVTAGGGAPLSSVDPSGTTEDCPASRPDCDLTSPPLTSIMAESTYHVMFLTIDGNRVKVEVQRPDGSLVDQFIIDKKGG
jgi:hypothetical protein